MNCLHHDPIPFKGEKALVTGQSYGGGRKATRITLFCANTDYEENIQSIDGAFPIRGLFAHAHTRIVLSFFFLPPSGVANVSLSRRGRGFSSVGDLSLRVAPLLCSLHFSVGFMTIGFGNPFISRQRCSYRREVGISVGYLHMVRVWHLWSLHCRLISRSKQTQAETKLFDTKDVILVTDGIQTYKGHREQERTITNK